LGKIVAVVQSNYIPWKGYFDLIHLADELILLDDVQYTRQDWRNRNLIKTPSGPRWLSVPVVAKGQLQRKINETKVSDPAWATRHWDAIRQNYATAPHFKAYRDAFEDLYASDETYLSRINRSFIDRICRVLGVTTPISWSSDYEVIEGPTARLVWLCKQSGASIYLSGPAARGYIEPELFEDAGIELRYMDYSGYPEYRQLHPPFEHSVTALDLIFNEGADATRYMRTFGTAGAAARDTVRTAS